MTDSVNHMRLRFDKAEVLEDGCRVRVTVSYAARVVEAEAAMEDAPIGYLKAAATATLKAVEETVGQRFAATLADLDHVNALGKDLIAVLIDIEFEGREVQVFGSCQKTGNDIDAAVKSALNATNRFFELSMRE